MPTNFDSALHALRGTGGPAAAILATLTLAGLGLTACGGSSTSASSHSNAAAQSNAAVTSTTGASTSSTATSHPGGTPTSTPPRFLAIRECLQKDGIVLPKSRPGIGADGLGLPKGTTPAQFQAALKKCGGGNQVTGSFGRPNSPASVRANSSAFRLALAKFATCLRQNGVNIPAPNTSGKGPIFSTKGIKTSSPQFRTATMKCRGVLIGAFRAGR